VRKPCKAQWVSDQCEITVTGNDMTMENSSGAKIEAFVSGDGPTIAYNILESSVMLEEI